MLIELLTPLMLATAPVRIDIPESTYTHANQVNERTEGTSTQFTFNGTQTFAPNGRPSDNDSD
jgi:hypothetical protein